MWGITNIIFSLISVVVAITLHEFGHGYVSWKLGDPTPERENRLSLNPLKY